MKTQISYLKTESFKFLDVDLTFEILDLRSLSKFLFSDLFGA